MERPPYLVYAIALVILAIVSALAGVMFDHWGFEIASGIMAIAAAVLLIFFPAKQTKTERKEEVKNHGE